MHDREISFARSSFVESFSFVFLFLFFCFWLLDNLMIFFISLTFFLNLLSSIRIVTCLLTLFEKMRYLWDDESVVFSSLLRQIVTKCRLFDREMTWRQASSVYNNRFRSFYFAILLYLSKSYFMFISILFFWQKFHIETFKQFAKNLKNHKQIYVLMCVDVNEHAKKQKMKITKMSKQIKNLQSQFDNIKVDILSKLAKNDLVVGLW